MVNVSVFLGGYFLGAAVTFGVLVAGYMLNKRREEQERLAIEAQWAASDPFSDECDGHAYYYKDDYLYDDREYRDQDGELEDDW